MGCYWGKPHDRLTDEGQQPPASSHEREKGRSSQAHGYRKLHILGRGSAAKVRLCQRRSDGQLFAMKIFNKSLLRRQRHWDDDAECFSDGFDRLRE